MSKVLKSYSALRCVLNDALVLTFDSGWDFLAGTVWNSGHPASVRIFPEWKAVQVFPSATRALGSGFFVPFHCAREAKIGICCVSLVEPQNKSHLFRSESRALEQAVSGELHAASRGELFSGAVSVKCVHGYVPTWPTWDARTLSEGKFESTCCTCCFEALTGWVFAWTAKPSYPSIPKTNVLWHENITGLILELQQCFR